MQVLQQMKPEDAAVSTESASSDTAASGEKIINVGVTNTIGSLNPLLLNGGEINKYATGLMFCR